MHYSIPGKAISRPAVFLQAQSTMWNKGWAVDGLDHLGMSSRRPDIYIDSRILDDLSALEVGEPENMLGAIASAPRRCGGAAAKPGDPRELRASTAGLGE